MEILLDGKLIKSKAILFKVLKEQIDSDEFYGNNLDALWDVLSFTNIDLDIKIINKDQLIKNIGEYGNTLIALFKDLKEADVNVTMTIK